MSKTILILVILVIVVVVVLGIFLMMGGTGNNQGGTNTPGSTETALRSFDVQGVKVDVLKEGTGEEAVSGDNVTVHYVGFLADGSKFDSSVDRNAPFTFMLGKGRVIKGWDLGVAGMKINEKRRLVIPPESAYGQSGFLTIPGNATLTFEVELLRVSK